MRPLENFFAKITMEKKILLLLTPLLTVLVNAEAAIICLSILILLDLITGAYKSLHKKKVSLNPLKRVFWRTISSRGMRETWKKGYEYGLGIIVLALVESLILQGMIIDVFNKSFSFAELGILCACVIEVYSIFENIEEVTGNNPLKKISEIVKFWK